MANEKMEGIPSLPGDSTTWTAFVDQFETMKKGDNSVTLTEWTPGNNDRPEIAAGSAIEIAGGAYRFPVQTPITDISGLAAGTVFVMIIANNPGADDATPYLTNTPPVWRDDLNGWYNATGDGRYTEYKMLWDGAVTYSQKIQLLDNARLGLEIGNPSGGWFRVRGVDPLIPHFLETFSVSKGSPRGVTGLEGDLVYRSQSAGQMVRLTGLTDVEKDSFVAGFPSGMTAIGADLVVGSVSSGTITVERRDGFSTSVLDSFVFNGDGGVGEAFYDMEYAGGDIYMSSYDSNTQIARIYRMDGFSNTNLVAVTVSTGATYIPLIASNGDVLYSAGNTANGELQIRDLSDLTVKQTMYGDSLIYDQSMTFLENVLVTPLQADDIIRLMGLRYG